MVSTTEEITDDIQSLPMTLTTIKKLNTRKSMCLYTHIFDVEIELTSVVL